MNQGPEEAAGFDPYDKVVAALNKHQVEFMIIGGFAVVYHGHVRLTEDLDIYIRSTQDNAQRTVAALEEAGFGCPELSPEVFTADNGISIGEKPMKVDIISQLPGVAFDEAWARREISFFGPETANYISREDLIKNKHAVGRPKDLIDARELEAGRDQRG